MSEGVDYSWGWRPGLGAALKLAGKTFVCRYLSGNPRSGKDLTAPERDDLHGAGLNIVLVWETDGRTGPLMGMQGGQLDANAAVAQARALGVPAGTCLYFAVDFDALSGNMAALRSYFGAARSICRAAGYRCGDYGGWAAIAGDQGVVDCSWQTYAWSQGRVYSGIALEQYLNGQRVAGVTVDLDRSYLPDYGQWPAPGVTVPGGTTLPAAPPTRPAWISLMLAFPGGDEKSGRGYQVDGWGGLHPFGGQPAAHGYAYWPGWCIARWVSLSPDGTQGVTLDGYGGLHPFAIDGVAPPAAPTNAPYWVTNGVGYDVAQQIQVVQWGDTLAGYTIDGYGGIHPWGGGPPAEPLPGYWQGGVA